MARRGGIAVIAATALAVGCGPGQVDEGGDEVADTGSEGADAETGTGDGDTGTTTGDGDTGTTSTDTTTTTGDGDTGTTTTGETATDTGPVCEPGYIPCPDDSCQLEQFNDPHECCGHGGSCLAGCEPQDAASTLDDCPEPGFAWTGDGCTTVCACEGGDCDALYPSLSACFTAHEPDCGFLGPDQCPFEMVLGPTEVAGQTPAGPRTFTHGGFGLVLGKGSGTDLNIRLATSPEVLGNYLWKLWEWPTEERVLEIFGASVEPGEYLVSVSLITPFPDSVEGTLIIESVDTEGAGHQDYGLVATLEVDAPDWQLSGSFAIYGCAKLDIFLP